VIGKKIGISAGSIHKLLFIEEHQPELLKIIDMGDITINGAYTETKRHLNFISLSEYVSKRKKDIPLNIENLTIYNKSSEEMVEVESGSVQTIVTSPPYYQKRSYQTEGQIGLEKSIDEHLNRLMTVMKECKRVLKEDGSMFLVIGDSYDENGSLRQVPHRLSLAMTDDGWILRNTLVWHKRNSKPENAKIRRWGTSYEFIFFFTLSMRYSFDMDKIRVPFTQDFSTALTSGTPRHHKTDGNSSIRQHTFLRHPLGKVPRDFIEDDVVQTTLNQNVDKYVPDKNLEHSATFPEKLIKPFILGTSKEGDTILDPFIGSGTTAKVSLDNGRKCVGYDISPVFVDTSYQRCGELINEESLKVV
jgi:DNA modification methylase